MYKNEGTAELIMFLVIGWTYRIVMICALVFRGKGPYEEHLAPARWRVKD